MVKVYYSSEFSITRKCIELPERVIKELAEVYNTSKDFIENMDGELTTINLS